MSVNRRRNADPLIFPLYSIRIVPVGEELPADWQLLSTSKLLRKPFVLKWRVQLESERSEAGTAENAEDAMRLGNATADHSADSDRTNSSAGGPSCDIDHFELRLAGPDTAEAIVLTCKTTQADLTPVWDQLPAGIIRYDIVAFDQAGRELGCSLVHNFVKERHPISQLKLPSVTVAEGARTAAVVWAGVEGALLRHIRPFVVEPLVEDTSLREKIVAWKVEIAHTGGCETVRSDDACGRISVSSVWDNVETGPCMLRIQALDEKGAVIALSVEQVFKKGSDFDGQRPKTGDYEACIRRIGRYLIHFRTAKAFQPGMPTFLWHSSVDEWGNVSGSSYPSQFEVGVEAWLLYGRWALDKQDHQAAESAFSQARQMVDFMLEHRTPTDWAFPSLPATTLTRGRLGGHQEGNSISLPGAATIARTFVWMYQETGEDKYLQAALNVANSLLPIQNTDGSWPWRIKPESGEPDYAAAYTSQIIEIVRLYDLVNAVYPQKSYRQAAEKGLLWILSNPVKTNRWEGYYVDDPGGMPLYSGVSHLDAVWTARYFVKHRSENQSYLSLARQINHWVEDHFVIYGRETHWGNSSIVSTEPITPAVIEKPFYQRTVTGHTANWVGLLLDLYRAAGDESYLHKALAGCNAIAAAVLPHGAVSPESPDRVLLRRPKGESLWFWNAWAAMKALLEMQMLLEKRDIAVV